MSYSFVLVLSSVTVLIYQVFYAFPEKDWKTDEICSVHLVSLECNAFAVYMKGPCDEISENDILFSSLDSDGRCFIKFTIQWCTLWYRRTVELYFREI